MTLQADTSAADHLGAILAAINDVTRFAARGCAGASCDRVRVAWMGTQLHTIATHAAELPEDVKAAHPELRWEQLATLTDRSSGTPGGLTADEMQRFVERELPRLRKVLVPLAKS
ncbi:hypothetical protein ACFLUT_02205 [Chloroflexota bacterium]